MKKLVIALTLSLLAAGLALVVSTYAQNVGGEGIDTPPPPGQVVLYMFTGAADNQNSIATSIHCTNYNSAAAAALTVEIIDKDLVPVFSDSATISPGHTATFSTRDTQVFNEAAAPWGNIIPGDGTPIDQGSGRVMAAASGSTQVICTAQLVDPTSSPPAFMSNVTLYRP